MQDAPIAYEGLVGLDVGPEVFNRSAFGLLCHQDSAVWQVPGDGEAEPPAPCAELEHLEARAV